MKAFVVEKYGKDSLRAADVPEPTVGPRDVLVRVSAASINPLDKMVRNGEFKRVPPWILRSLGADVVIDYTKENFADVLSGYDLVLDSLGGNNLEKSLTVLKPGGLAIGVAGPPDAGFAKQTGAPSFVGLAMNLLSRKIRKQARARGVRYEFFFMQANGSQLRELAVLYDDGHLRPVIDRTFPFDQTVEAMKYVEQGGSKAGKVVVAVTPQAS